LDVSVTKGKSFNDNVTPNSLERITMLLAQRFGFAILLRAGKNTTAEI
jgi:predicted nucleotidyltransferase